MSDDTSSPSINGAGLDSAQSLVSLFFDSETVISFLNTSQTGSAHSAYGTELSVLFKHLITAFCICLIEISLFCYLRPFFKGVYQPRCYFSPENERVEALPPGFFSWVLPTWNHSTESFLSAGLDTYFFLRFINMLLIFFATCGTFNMIVLLPVNFTGSSENYKALGLDVLSISNIAKSKVGRLNVHFACSLVTVVVFNIFIYIEFQNIAKARHSYLHSFAHRAHPSSRILLLGNIPRHLRDTRALQKLFGSFDGGLERVWFTEDYHHFRWICKQGFDALDILEAEQVSRLKYMEDTKLFAPNDNCALFHPPIYLKIIRIPIVDRVVTMKLPGFLRAFTMQKKVPVVDWCVITLTFVHKTLMQRVENLHAEDFVKQDKVFLMFDTSEAAYVAHQTLLSSSYGILDESVVEVNAKDVIWENVVRPASVVGLLERNIVHMVIIVFIAIYIVPVSLITLFSQITFVTQLLPFMRFLNRLPEEIKITFTSLMPSILLTIVTGIQLKIFRILLLWKGNWTVSGLELDIQTWYFIFLFVQQFLVVSVSSSLTSIIVQVVEKPASIPLLLASNIPRSSIFFFKYLSIKALALCGNNFLRINDLFSYYFLYRWIDNTPRKKYRRMTNLKRVRWGSVYSTFSVYGAIGITYTTISPIVSLFMVAILLLTLLYYKHALQFMFSHVNEFESRGRLYPKALFQLYAGVYCLEFCMIGILSTQKNSRGDYPMKFQAMCMAFAMISTVFINIMAYNRFKNLFNYFPQIHDDDFAMEEEFPRSADDRVAEPLAYYHPCYQFEKPTVWLPEDKFGRCKELISELTVFTSAFAGGSTEGAMLVKEGIFHRLEVWRKP